MEDVRNKNQQDQHKTRTAITSCSAAGSRDLDKPYKFGVEVAVSDRGLCKRCPSKIVKQSACMFKYIRFPTREGVYKQNFHPDVYLMLSNEPALR